MKSLILIISVLVAVSCNGNLVFKGNEKVVGNKVIKSQNYQFKGVTAIKNSSIANVVFVQDSTFATTLTTDENILPYFIIEQKGNELIIKQKDKINLEPTQAVIEVHIPLLNKIVNSGTGDFKSDLYKSEKDMNIDNTGTGDISFKTIAINSLIINNTGTGDVKSGGFVNKLNLTNSGTGDFKCEELVVNEADIANTGTGDVNLQVKERAEFNNSGTGDIYYQGNPKVANVHNTGTGKVHKK